MALGYEVIITDSKGSEIKLDSMKKENNGKGDIIGASYKSNTLNDDSMSRSNDVRAEIKIIGRITKYNFQNTCELAKWSNESNPDLVYRKIKLIIHPTSSDTSILRSYEISEMFVLDYEEYFELLEDSINIDYNDYKKENDNGLFVMYLAQRSGNYDLYVETE